MPGITTGSTGSLATFHRARPTGQSARRYFLDAFARLLGGVVLAAAFSVVHLQFAWTRWPLPCYTLLVAGGETQCGSQTLAPFAAGVWALSPEVPLHEHFALVFYELVTWPPVTVALSIAALVTVLLYCEPGLNRLPLGRAP